MTILGYLAFIFMGLSLGMIGGGGSILTVPILVYLLKIDPILSTAYSLFVVGSTALVGGFFYLKRGEVDLRTGAIFALPSFVAVYLVRSLVVPNLPEQVVSLGGFHFTKSLLVMAIFAILMLLASSSMIRKTKTSQGVEMSPVMKFLVIALEGFLVGGVTGFVGAGGGFLIIPALVVLVGLPMRIAVGTSLLIISAKSLVGFTGDLQHQAYIDWTLLWTVTGIAIVGLLIGTQLSSRVSDEKLKTGFGYFTLVMGTLILIDQIAKL